MNASIKNVGEVLAQQLNIPHYQRPYRWTQKNVLQLLEDIFQSMYSGKKQYRIGSLILHRNQESYDQNSYDIVDGQQRLTTLILILKQCQIGKELVFPNLKYNSHSVLAIKENYSFIANWMNRNNIEKASLGKYVTESCQFVQIEVDDQSEAFQMFDTQNGRGKSLEPYNLLKAYHIRAMEQNPQEEKIKCDQRWEAAAQYDATPEIENDPNVDILKQLFTEQLFRTRIWSRNEVAGRFTRNDIEEFKGFTIDKNHPVHFPYQNPQLLQYLTEKFYKNILQGTIGTFNRFESGDSDSINPFVNINQDIVNGQAFFDYIETYTELYKKMFLELGTYQLAEFKKFFFQYCMTYDLKDDTWVNNVKRSDIFRHISGKARRQGDTYLREIYKSLCLMLFDKFGEKVLMQFYKILYRLIYQLRLKYTQVRYSTAAQEVIKYFTIIYRAKNITDLLQLEKMAGQIVSPEKQQDRDDGVNRIGNSEIAKLIWCGGK